MKIAPKHLKRYKDVAVLFYKYANNDVFLAAGFEAPPQDEEMETVSSTNGSTEAGAGEKSGGDTEVGKDGETEGKLAAKTENKPKDKPRGGKDLAADLEKLGPTFVKIGQLLSTRADLLPPQYLVALERLQDHVEPIPFEEIERVVQEQLGVRLSKGFDSFERRPLGAASIGQVHLAKLRGGREVAVKVQRPGIRQQIVDDLESLAEIAEFIDAHTEFGRRYEIGRIVEHFRTTLMREMDYQKEALHLKELRANLAEFKHLLVPEVIDDYSTSTVLTMEYRAGTKITSLSGAVLVDLNGEALAEELFKAYLKQIIVDGFFHADPHPGNLLLTPGRNIAILDLGMIGRINQRMRDHLIHLLAGIADGNGLQTAEAALKIGEQRGQTIDRNLFINAIEEIVGSVKTRSVESIQVGAVVLLVMQACAASGIRIPSEISLLGKTLMNLDRVGITLAPNFNPNESIRRNLTEIASQRMKDSFTTANLIGTLSEAKEFISQLPSRLNRIVEMVADNKLSVKVESIDEHKLLQGLQKVANRITTGLILAAFIVGSSMLARVETSYRLFGYSGLAMFFFLIAVVGAVLLMIQIYWKDE
ncbi:MAG: AarF/UbiB family protein [Verrucomicrobiota bacterium]